MALLSFSLFRIDKHLFCICALWLASNRNLRSQLQSEKQIHERKERQLRVETNAKMFALEVRLSRQDFDIFSDSCYRNWF